MTLKRHEKQPDKKITAVRVVPKLDANVQSASSEYTPAVGVPDATIRTDVQTSGDTESVGRITKPLVIPQDVRQAQDEITPGMAASAPSVRTDVHSSDDTELVARLAAPSSVSTDVQTASDTERTARIAKPLQASRDVQVARDTVTITPGTPIPVISADVQTSDDTPRTLRITHALKTSTEVVQAQDTPNVARIAPPQQINTEVQTSRDTKTVAAKQPETLIPTEVVQAQDIERVARITAPSQISTEVVQAQDTTRVLSLKHTPIPNEIVQAPDAPTEWHSFEDDFGGAWLPKGDPVRIGLKNYSTLENFRYTDFGIEGVNGHTRINTNNTGTVLTNGIQLRTNYTQESYVIAQGERTASSLTPLIMANKGTVPGQANFDTYEWTIDNTSDVLYLGCAFAGSTITSYTSLTQATYADGSAVATHVQTKLNANSVLTHSGSVSFGVTYSLTTNKFTIACTGGTVKYFDTGSTAGTLLGLTEDQDYAASIVSDTAVSNDDPLYSETNNTSSNTARFSLLPRGQVGVCNQVENLIWAGDEMPVGAFLVCDIVEDDASNYTDFLKTLKQQYIEDYTDKINSSNSSDTVTLKCIDRAFGAVGSQFDITHYENGSKVRYAWDGTGTDPNFSTNGLAAGHVLDIVCTNFASGNRGKWKVLAATDSYFEVFRSDAITAGTETNKQLAGASDLYCYGKVFLVGSTRPIQSAKFTISTANTATGATTTMSVFGWDGNSFAIYDTITDGTESGGKTLVTTGESISFGSSTFTDVPVHIDGYYLYFYMFQPFNCNAVISQVTVNSAITDIADLWDGSYRKPIRCAVNIDGALTTLETDYTLEASTESYNDTDYQQYGVSLASLARGGHITLVFAERVAALRVRMLAGNTSDGGAVYAQVFCNNGGAWVEATVVADTTARYSNLDDYRTTPTRQPLNSNGIIQWEVPSTESKVYEHGVYGYAYRIKLNDSTDAKLAAGTIMDTIEGITAHGTISNNYLFPFSYKNRTMLCNSISDKEYNRVDYSAYKSPDVYNGDDASGRDNQRSLYFGDSRELTSATEVYGIYGDTADTLALFFKENETYILTGDNPETFRIFTLSTTIGNPAPLSLASTASILSKDTASISTNVALWISNKGPCMYIGNTIYSIPGLEPYFDPNDALYLGASYIKEARGWCDPVYHEYNVIIPTGTTNTAKIWFVYDLVRHKWYRKKPTLDFPSGAIIVEDSNGNKYAYGYCSTGYMVRLDNGLLWSADSDYEIVGVVKNADMVLSGNLWHESTVRQIRVLHEHNALGNLTIKHYVDGNTSPVQGIVSYGGSYYGCNVTHVSGTFSTDLAAGYWTALEYASSATAWVTATRYNAMPAEVTMAESSSYRYKRYLYNLNATGFSHAFELTVNGCTAYKPKLLGWGLTYDTREDKGSLSG